MRHGSISNATRCVCQHDVPRWQFPHVVLPDFPCRFLSKTLQNLATTYNGCVLFCFMAKNIVLQLTDYQQWFDLSHSFVFWVEKYHRRKNRPSESVSLEKIFTILRPKTDTSVLSKRAFLHRTRHGASLQGRQTFLCAFGCILQENHRNKWHKSRKQSIDVTFCSVFFVFDYKMR